MILAPIVAAAIALTPGPIVEPVSVAAVEPSYITAPCRAFEGRDGAPALMRTDDNVIRLGGSDYARKALALGHRRFRMDGASHTAPDQRVQRQLGSRFVALDDEPKCSVGIEGAA